MITGLIWWYPKKWTKSTRDKSFTIDRKGNWKRVNLDLHIEQHHVERRDIVRANSYLGLAHIQEKQVDLNVATPYHLTIPELLHNQ